MLLQVAILVKTHLRAILRDRVLYAVLGVALSLILLVPALSSFSMRQVQELAITLSLSAVSGVLLVITLLLGASSIWRDIERRYTTSVLTLPVARAVFLLSKFISISLFLILCALVLGLGSAAVIVIAAHSYPSDIPIHWGNIVLVLTGDVCKYLLLAAFALLLSSVSTSFYLPFFGTLAIFFCGSASQEVFEYVSGEFGQGMSPLASKAVTVAYYLLPNFAAFDFQVQAVYGLTVPLEGFLLAVAYCLVYTGILLGLAVFAFGRRELP
jgi:ABC-type transport system involved in multi-copper enzyme maturation permease subunit